MSIIKKPIITEKANAMSEKGVYTFEVDKSANKIEIKKAIESLYNVNVNVVRTIRCVGKAKSRSSQSKVSRGRTSTYKKAMISLSDGEVIDFYGE